MDLVSISQGALKLVEDWIKNHKNDKEKEKQEKQINCYKKDLKEVIYKTDHDVPRADSTELGHIRDFVVEKQGNLKKRTLIPPNMRDEGNAVYSASLAKIDACRHKFLKVA
ncbi:MAG TPA: hypothetical protein VLE96_07450 [Chlamydiales bacterium]|nr:hypothetical protein [Chlamydiales bacterium]